MKPICKRSNHNRVITFDSHLKTALMVVVRDRLSFFNYIFLQHSKSSLIFWVHVVVFIVIFCFQILMNVTH